MNRDDDIQVPDFGPAEPAGNSRPQTPAPEPAKAVEPQRKQGGGLIQSFVMILLIVAVCGLGYLGFDMYESQQAREATFKQAETQIEQLKVLLQEAEQGAAKSGEAIKGNVNSLEANLSATDKELKSEIAKLWVIAHQRNKPELEKQGKALAAQKGEVAKLAKKLAAQEKSVKALKSSLVKQDKQIKSLAGLKAENEKLQASVKSEVAKLQKLVSRIETEVRTSAELNQEQQNSLTRGQRTLSDRVTKLESKSTAALERRVKVNEQAVRAFDGTRRQLNQDLLQVKQKLNNLQLMLEQR